jgi:hypothetical protein
MSTVALPGPLIVILRNKPKKHCRKQFLHDVD